MLALVMLLALATLGQSQSPAPAVPRALNADLLGSVQTPAGAAVPDARVTLFKSDLSFFLEARTSSSGTYIFAMLPAGAYRLGVAAPGWEYVEVAQALVAGTNQHDFVLAPQANVGLWNIIGNTLPELFDATDMGILRTDGRVMYCHNTVSPVLFDPTTGQKTLPPGSGSEQGCMNSTLLEDGSVLIVGGQSPDDPQYFTNAVPWVKRFTPQLSWVQQANMLLQVGRWYPGLARLADGRLLIMGGGTSPSAARTDTCEIYTPSTQGWAYTDTMNSALEFPPCALLYDGRVLRTWGTSPELYDPALAQWVQDAPFVAPNRGFPGHSDHSLIILGDGRGLAVGVSQLNQPTAAMTEIFDPATSSWSAGTSPSLVRMQTEVVHLPDGRVFVGAGDAENHVGSEPNILSIVRRCDLLDPLTMAWTRVPDMAWYREYHAVTLLVPDGRVLTTGGTRIKFQYGPTSADIEAYSPPYLFRGVRPQLSNLSDPSPARGQTIRFRVFPATKLTSVVLMGTQSTTHWVDGGIPRRLVLPVSQPASLAEVRIPLAPNLAPLGWYMLFGMVDDIPSKALILRVDP
jgi:hypothetical protein